LFAPRSTSAKRISPRQFKLKWFFTQNHLSPQTYFSRFDQEDIQIMCTKTIKRAVAQNFDASVQQRILESIFGKDPKVYFSTAQNGHLWFKELQKNVKDAIKERCTSIFGHQRSAQTSQLQFPKSYKDLLPKIQQLAKLFSKANSIPCCRFRDENDCDDTFRRIFEQELSAQQKPIMIEGFKVLSDIGLLNLCTLKDGEIFICANPQYLAKVMSVFSDPSGPNDASSKNRSTILVNQTKQDLITILLESKVQTQCDDFAKASKLFDFLEGMGVIKEIHPGSGSFYVPISLKGRPSFWIDVFDVLKEHGAHLRDLSQSPTLYILGRRFSSASHSRVSVALFFKIMSSRSSFMQKWGCAFIIDQTKEDGAIYFIRLFEDRTALDVIRISDRSSVGTGGTFKDRDIAQEAFRTGDLHQTYLCPLCCSSNMYMRAGTAHCLGGEAQTSVHTVNCPRAAHKEMEWDIIESGFPISAEQLRKTDQLLHHAPSKKVEELRWMEVAIGGIIVDPNFDPKGPVSLSNFKHGEVLDCGFFTSFSAQLFADSKGNSDVLHHEDVVGLMEAAKATPPKKDYQIRHLVDFASNNARSRFDKGFKDLKPKLQLSFQQGDLMKNNSCFIEFIVEPEVTTAKIKRREHQAASSASATESIWVDVNDIYGFKLNQRLFVIYSVQEKQHWLQCTVEEVNPYASKSPALQAPSTRCILVPGEMRISFYPRDATTMPDKKIANPFDPNVPLVDNDSTCIYIHRCEKEVRVDSTDPFWVLCRTLKVYSEFEYSELLGGRVSAKFTSDPFISPGDKLCITHRSQGLVEDERHIYGCNVLSVEKPKDNVFIVTLQKQPAHNKFDMPRELRNICSSDAVIQVFKEKECKTNQQGVTLWQKPDGNSNHQYVSASGHPGRGKSLMMLRVTPQNAQDDPLLAAVWTELQDQFSIMLGSHHKSYDITSATLYRNSQSSKQFEEVINKFKHRTHQAEVWSGKKPTLHTSLKDERENISQPEEVLDYFKNFTQKYSLLPQNSENSNVNLISAWWGHWLGDVVYTGIAQNGFKELPSIYKIDPGFYGNGYYLTRCPRYSDYYISDSSMTNLKNDGCLLL